MIVVADTSPLNYLALINEIHLLPALYGSILIPPSVVAELERTGAPLLVREWIASRPAWLIIDPPQHNPDPRLSVLDWGERDAITLALEREADLILIDEREGREVAQAYGLRVAGILRVLADAALVGLVSLPDVFGRLRATQFRVSDSLLAVLLAEVKRELG